MWIAQLTLGVFNFLTSFPVVSNLLVQLKSWCIFEGKYLNQSKIATYNPSHSFPYTCDIEKDWFKKESVELSRISKFICIWFSYIFKVLLFSWRILFSRSFVRLLALNCNLYSSMAHPDRRTVSIWSWKKKRYCSVKVFLLETEHEKNETTACMPSIDNFRVFRCMFCMCGYCLAVGWGIAFAI